MFGSQVLFEGTVACTVRNELVGYLSRSGYPGTRTSVVVALT